MMIPVLILVASMSLASEAVCVRQCKKEMKAGEKQVKKSLRDFKCPEGVSGAQCTKLRKTAKKSADAPRTGQTKDDCAKLCRKAKSS